MPYNDKDDSKSDLDPWRIISACLFELDSYAIPAIVDRSGMNVDWTLTDRDNFSHMYRKNVYRPRINQAYNALIRADKLRVAFIVCEQLAHRGREKDLNDALDRIGWRVENGKLIPTTAPVRELFFPPRTHHDAYVEIKKIVRQAECSLRIIDSYLDGTIFQLLGDVDRHLKVGLLAGKLPVDFELERDKFRRQYPNIEIEIRRSREFHDRFVVVDEKECWHIGCSIKDAGSKAFLLCRIEDPQNSQAILRTLKEAWTAAAQPIARRNSTS